MNTVTTTEACAMLGIIPHTLSKWVRRGVVRQITPGKRGTQATYDREQIAGLHKGMGGDGGNGRKVAIPDGYLTMADAGRKYHMTRWDIAVLVKYGFAKIVRLGPKLHAVRESDVARRTQCVRYSEAARMLGIDRSRFQLLQKSGILWRMNLGRKYVLYRRSTIESLAELKRNDQRVGDAQ